MRRALRPGLRIRGLGGLRARLGGAVRRACAAVGGAGGGAGPLSAVEADGIARAAREVEGCARELRRAEGGNRAARLAWRVLLLPRLAREDLVWQLGGEGALRRWERRRRRRAGERAGLLAAVEEVAALAESGEGGSQETELAEMRLRAAARGLWPGMPDADAPLRVETDAGRVALRPRRAARVGDVPGTGPELEAVVVRLGRLGSRRAVLREAAARLAAAGAAGEEVSGDGLEEPEWRRAERRRRRLARAEMRARAEPGDVRERRRELCREREADRTAEWARREREWVRRFGVPSPGSGSVRGRGMPERVVRLRPDELREGAALYLEPERAEVREAVGEAVWRVLAKRRGRVRRGTGGDTGLRTDDVPERIRWPPRRAESRTNGASGRVAARGRTGKVKA